MVLELESEPKTWLWRLPQPVTRAQFCPGPSLLGCGSLLGTEPAREVGADAHMLLAPHGGDVTQKWLSKLNTHGSEEGLSIKFSL